MSAPLKIEADGRLDREMVGAWLSELAASLIDGDDSDIEFNGTRFRIDVAKQLDLHVAIEADASHTHLGIEISWQ